MIERWAGRSTWHSFASSVGEAPAPGYRKLFDVAVQHDYYNLHNDRRCFDFDVLANAQTDIALRALGMLLRRDGSGFSVFYDAGRLGRLVHYLRTATTGAADHSTYLSFLLALRAPRFMNVTDLPLGFNPLSQNYYFKNAGPTHEAPDADSRVYLPRHRLTVMPARFPITISQNGHATLKNAAGQVEQTIPAPSQRGPRREFDTRDPATRGYYVDLSQLFEGRYRLEGAQTGPRDFIYTNAHQASLCFIDIFLNQPTATAEGVYPMPARLFDRGLDDLSSPEPAPTPRYLVHFAARQTKWVYYIAPRAPGAILARDLQIRRAGKAPAPTFVGPYTVTLPNGARAFQFIATELLPLHQRSDVNLQLLGKGGTVLMPRLPVASAEQVLANTQCPPTHEPPPKGTLFSDIYVYV